jgi:hypothetical protein
MKKFILHIILLFSYEIIGQVNIGNQFQVDSRVILDLSNNINRVLRLPTPTILPTSPEGLIFYDTVKEFVFYSKDGINLNAFSPWKYSSSSNELFFVENGNVGIGNLNPTSKLTIEGGTESQLAGNSGFVLIGDPSSQHLLIDSYGIMAKNGNSNSTLYLQNDGGHINVNGSIKTNNNDLIPSGTIIMWYGTASGNYPEISGVTNQNWHICNGNNGTPDLRNRFIVASGNSYSLDDTGGSTSPSHTHNINPSSENSTSTSHNHTSGGPSSSLRSSINGTVPCWHLGTYRDVGKDDHTHSSDNNSHSHSVDISNTGSDAGSIDNRPPYYALYYIYKL